MRSFISSLCMLALVFVSLWILGFLWFLGQLPVPSTTPDYKHSDAIVVLTGGSGRIDHGLKQLEKGMAEWLFITGVNQSSPSDAVFADDLKKNDRYRRFKDHIVLGRMALNTQGNAEEARLWMEQKNFKSMRLVTASYHMPRSLLEFRIAMPEITVLADPVFPPDVTQRWWQSGSGVLLMLSEYHKYTVTLIYYMIREG
jgi:uncharacterized SAM-binding protein YcdF (DUF218 family)